MGRSLARRVVEWHPTASHLGDPPVPANPSPRPRSRTLRAGLGALLAISALAAVAGCGVEAGEELSAGIASGGGDVVGSDVEETTTTEVTTTTLPETDVVIEGDDGSDLNQVAANAIADLEEFWDDAYPEAYGEPYEPLTGGVFAIDGGTDPSGIPCAGSDISELLDNAFYCPPDDAVVWDQEGFMPALAERYGPFTVAVVIAHEWGHVIQGRTGYDEASVLVELQADCFAGAWTEHVIETQGERFDIGTEELDQALAGILSLRDAPGGSADDPFAHGSGFDRVSAFQDGYEDGVERCAAFTNGDPIPFQWPFSEAELDTGGDLPLATSDPDDDILDLTFPALDAFWAEVFPSVSGGDEWDPLGDPVAFDAGDEPECGGEQVEGFVLFVCIPDRFVGFELEQTMGAAYDQNGDFAVATLIATQYGLDAVNQLGSAEDEITATLQGDCFAGSFAAALLPDDTGTGPFDLVLSPGDLDEGVSALLSFRSEGDRDRQGPGFDRVRAYRRGVLEGPEACLDIG
jgi:predicted metalloprotease